MTQNDSDLQAFGKTLDKYISKYVEIVFRKRIWPKTEPLQLDLDLIYRKYQMQ